MSKLISFNEILDQLACYIASEMKIRGIETTTSDSSIVSLEERKSQGIYEAHLLDTYNTKERCDSELMTKRIERWGKELAIKIARPFPITTFHMEIPQNVHESGESIQSGLILRGVTDYCLHSPYEQFEDRILYRFTICLKWNDN